MNRPARKSRPASHRNRWCMPVSSQPCSLKGIGGRERESNPPETGSLPHSDLKSERPTRDDSLPLFLSDFPSDECAGGLNKSRRYLLIRRKSSRFRVTP